LIATAEFDGNLRAQMVDGLFFQSLGIIVVSAAVLVMLGRMIRMPAIVVYLLCGVLIGPVLGLVEMNEALELISSTGIALLLFLVGLELSFDKIRNVGKIALIAGIGQVVFTAVGGLLISLMLGFDLVTSAFIGAGITFSSTVIAVKLLDEKREINTHHGHIAVACSLVQSIIVIFLLTILTGIGGQDTSAAKMTIELSRAVGGVLLLGAIAFLFSRYLLAKPFKWAAKSPDMTLVWSLSWCFSMILLARFLGLSLEIGSFLAGISLAQLPHNNDLHRRVHPLMSLFMAIFFVTLGIPMTFGGLGSVWVAALVLSVFVIIGNTLIYVILIPRLGFSARTALLTGITGAQISEFSFILVAMGVGLGMLNPELVGLMTLIGLLTMGASAYMILHNHKIANGLERLGVLKWFQATTSVDPAIKSDHLEKHIIVVGMNTLGRDLARRLCKCGETVVAVDTDPGKLEGLPCRTLLGSVEYLSVLEEAGYERAKLLVSALRIEDVNDILAFRCQHAGVSSAIHVVDLSVVDNLLELGVDYLMIPKVDGVKAQVKKLKEMGVIES